MSAGVHNFGLIAGFYVGSDGQDQGFIADASKSHNGVLIGIQLRTVGDDNCVETEGVVPHPTSSGRVEIFHPFSGRRPEE